MKIEKKWSLRTVIAFWKGKSPKGNTGMNGLKKYRVKKFSFQAIIENYLYSGCQKFVPIICHCEEFSDEAIFLKT
jgi:hypothetical protein